MQQHDERDEQQAEHEHRRGATARERKREATQDVDMGAIRPVSSVQAALAAAEAAGYQGSVQAAQAAAEPAGHAEFCRASLQAAPAAPEAAQGCAPRSRASLYSSVRLHTAKR